MMSPAGTNPTTDDRQSQAKPTIRPGEPKNAS